MIILGLDDIEYMSEDAIEMTFSTINAYVDKQSGCVNDVIETLDEEVHVKSKVKCVEC